jgi:predicted kinase
MTAANLIQDFIDNAYIHYKEMKDVEHGYLGIYPNSFHLEGSVWNHTLMVLKQAENSTDIMKVIALLHDIGKAYVFKDNYAKGRRSFRGHENVSFFYASKIIDDLGMFSFAQKNLILFTIANHGGLYRYFENGRIPEHNYSKLLEVFNKQQLELLFEFYKYDHSGRFYINERFNVQDELYRDFEKILSSADDKEYYQKDKTIHVLIGLPRAGKSTFRKHLIGTVISRDDILMENSDQSYTKTFQSLSPQEHKEIDRIEAQRFQQAVKNGEDIVIDKTNLSKKSRNKYLSNLKGYTKKAYVFTTDIDTCKSRNTSDKYIPESVIDDMAKSLSFPRYDEFDEVLMV